MQSTSSNHIQNPDQAIVCNNFFNGKWQKPNGSGFAVVSPYTNQVIGESAETTAKDLDQIVDCAKRAQTNWASIPIKERSTVMFRFRELLLRDIEVLSQRISLECGKTFIEASAEILKGVEVIEFALSIQNLDVGGRTEVSRGVFCEYRREALGVVAAITPFNFPAMVPMWMIPIAITLGNSFIWKPSEKTPLTSILIADLLGEAGLPNGVFNVVHGGKTVVENILDHPDVKAVGFVGSTPVAKAIYARGSKNWKRVLALGGAKNHILLMPDADLDLTSKGVADSFTGCAGQRCMAASVLCAIADSDEEKMQIEKLIQAILGCAHKITLGDRMGAIISRSSLQKLEAAITRAESDGAKILLDGRNPAHPAKYQGGNWLAPTILDNVSPDSFVAQEELFGPVLSIVRCRNLKEALNIQSKSPYGNAISIFTQNGAAAEMVASMGQAGMVGINIGVPVPREPFSFGGTQDSKFGHGDITGVHSLNFWSDIKKVTTKWAAQKDATWMG